MAFLVVVLFFWAVAAGAFAVVLFSLKKPKPGGIVLGICIVSFAVSVISAGTLPANTPSSTDSAAAAAQTTASPDAADSPEATDPPTPGSCDVQKLRKLDTKPGADVMAGADPGAAINAAADAENECSRSLSGEQAYRHILAAGEVYLLGIHADDVNDKKGFMQYAIDTVHIVLGAPDASAATRAKAQEITDTANAKLEGLEQ